MHLVIYVNVLYIGIYVNVMYIVHLSFNCFPFCLFSVTVSITYGNIDE